MVDRQLNEAADAGYSFSSVMGGDSASSGYAGMLNQTLTSSIMSGGGTGIAMQIAKSIDPALAHPTADKSQGAQS